MTQHALAPSASAPVSHRYVPVEITHYEPRGRELMAFDTRGNAFRLGQLRAYDPTYMTRYAETFALAGEQRLLARRDLAKSLLPFKRTVQPDTVVEIGGAE